MPLNPFPFEIGGCVLQRLFTLAIVIITILWLVVSYLPGVQAILPTIAFRGDTTWLAWLALFAFFIFLAIQIWLVYTTVAAVRDFQAKGNGSPFRLRPSVELFWAVLPVAMTVGLAWASYALWSNLIKP
jgi:heme/copper-type cytochrome/quinol oxidase subunit 2